MQRDQNAPKGGGRGFGRGQKGCKVATPRYLENAALYYLERYAASSEALRRVLLRKVKRSAEQHGTDEREGARVVDELIERFRRSKLLDDHAVAESRARRLHERGGSARAIRAKLGAQGLGEEDIRTALSTIDEASEGDAEADAAWSYARRRRLGPYRREEGERKERRDKDLAAMARAGFGYGVASRVIDAPEPRDPTS